MSKRHAQRPQRRETVAALEAELVRLTTLVRERRDQLAKLENCPNPSCPCRQLWRNHVEKNLASQMGKIRRHVRGTRATEIRNPKAEGRKKAEIRKPK